jgi:hypothetical protein
MRALALSLMLAACATSARADEPLAPLAFLQGCWAGSFDSPGGLQDERCFEPMQGGRFVRDTHTVVGTGYGGESIYAWNAELRRIEVSYFAADGGLMSGVVAEESDGLWLREGRYVGPDGAIQSLRSHWIRNDLDGFTVETHRLEDGEWRQLMRIIYVRAPTRAE